MDGHFEIDERRWREKVRQRDHEIRHLKEELARHLGRGANAEPDSAILDAKIAELERELSLAAKDRDEWMQAQINSQAEIKELKDKIKGLNMQLGRLKGK